MPNFLESIKCLSLLALFLGLVPCRAHAFDRVCADPQGVISGHSGVYVDLKFLRSIQTLRVTSTAINHTRAVPAIWVQENKPVAMPLPGFHEGILLGDAPFHEKFCATFDESSLRRVAIFVPYRLKFAATYARLPVDDSYFEHTDFLASYFASYLLNGCYLDSMNRKWCFKDGALAIGARPAIKTQLALDTFLIEYPPGGGNALVTEDLKNIFVFAPSGHGWVVFKTRYLDAPDHVSPDWRHPYARLTPIG